MSGNHKGGLKAAHKILAYDPTHYVRIGRKGGQMAYQDGSPRGFAAMDRAKVKAAGMKGGSISHRGRARV